MAFNTPARCNASVKPLLDNSLSTHSFQSKVVLDPNSKRMGISIIRRVYERSTLTIGIVPCLLLIGTVRFEMGGLFTYISRRRIIRDNLFSLSLRELIHDPITQQASLFEVKDIMLDMGWDWGKIPFEIPFEVKGWFKPFWWQSWVDELISWLGLVLPKALLIWKVLIGLQWGLIQLLLSRQVGFGKW